MTTSAAPTSDHAPLIRKLETIGSLSEGEKAAISSLPLVCRTHAEGEDLLAEGDTPTECQLILEGLACRYKRIRTGRQIMSFHIAGDMPDVQSLRLPVMDHSIGALTPVRVGHIPHAALRLALAAEPGLEALFWRDSLIDAAVFREWLANVGRRTAYQRIAHLICELFMRMQAVGLTNGDRFKLQITQTEIGDSLGLTNVHVNRVLRELRNHGLVSTVGRSMVIEDWPALQAAADFNPRYLHLRSDVAA